MSTTIKLATGSLVIGFAVLGMKILAYRMTGSIALYSDALESTVNVVTAFAALIAVNVAAKPADETHPFGHHKAEFLSAVLEGVMIVIAALLILREAYSGLVNPVQLDLPLAGIMVNAVATMVNGIWAYILITYGRRQKSPALVADGRHLLTDVVTSVGVAAGILLALGTGWWILDPILAAFVAVNILWSGSKLVKESLSGLMDEAVPPEMLCQIREIITAHAHGAVEAHDLRTRHAGPVIFIEFHLIVSGEMTVFEAHEICDEIENALEHAFDGARIIIHVEPEHKSKDTGALVLN